jgi:hypothetical protein
MTIIEERLVSLKNDLRSEILSMEQMFQKHIVDPQSYYFISVLGDVGKEYEIRELVAKSLGVHLNEVVIVGSAKLGYSLNPKKLYNLFDAKFKETSTIRDKSDLDIAVISPELFKDLNIRIYDFTNSFKTKWVENEYYNGEKIKVFEVPINYKFFEYHTKGWFRPDFKPKGFEFCINSTFEDLKKSIIDITGRKVGLGIYKNWYFFKNYHIENLKRLQIQMKREIL